MKYFYVLTAETPWGDTYTVKGFAESVDAEIILKTATNELIEKASALCGVSQDDIDPHKLVIMFFNFWEC